MVKVQWRVVIFAAVMLVGWLSAAESNRRKVIIHIPHLHHGHKHSVRHVQKGHGSQSHAKVNGKGHGHVHKHHHHYYDDDHHGGHGEPSHSHTYEESGHHHHHHPPPSSSHHHHHPPPHHSHSHHHPVHHHHSDHHSHGSRHVEHHRHPEHHDDLDHHHHHLRTEETMYSYDHHHPEHSHQHHRVHHYDHHHPSTTRSYDCMEICERCRMKSRRHRYSSVSRGHDVTRSGSGTPLVSKVVTAGSPPTSNPASTGLRQGGYLVTESQEFKPIVVPGELRDPSDVYSAGYVFPKPLEVMPSAGKLNGPGSKPVQYHQDQVSEFDSGFADFQEYVPETQGWYNETFFFGKHEDPGVNVVGYHRQRAQQLQQHSSMRYVDEGMQDIDEGGRKERGRDLRFLNRHRYETTNR